MIARPKLPAQLSQAAAPVLEKALALENLELAGANWAGQDARRATFDTLRLINPDLTAAKLRESGWSDVCIEGGQLGALDITGSTWRRIEVGTVRMSGIILAEAELKNVLVLDAKLDMANFRFAKLSRVRFERCQFAEADFAAAQLADVSFVGCDLTSADFSGATVKRTDLRTSSLQDIRGLGGLAGATIDTGQLMQLAPSLAATIGLEVSDS